MDCIISLDVGGSSVKSALVAAADRTNIAVTTTPIDSRSDRHTILGTLRQTVQKHLLELTQRNASCLGVGVGFPGPCDYASGTVLVKGVEKYEALYGLNLRNELRTELNGYDLPIKLQNDAVCALVAEARYGERRLCERVLGIVLGTGMGSAFVVDGKQVVTGRGVPSSGYLYAEPFAGTTADEVFSTRGLQARLRKVNKSVSIPIAAQRARAGDKQLSDVFAEFGLDLGIFLAPYATEFQANALILLGGIAQTGDLFSETLEQHLPVPFYQGSLQDKAGVLGASLLF